MLLTREEAAKFLGISPISLWNSAYRARIGLPVIKVGRLVRFAESDLQKLVEKGRKHMPAMTSKS